MISDAAKLSFILLNVHLGNNQREEKKVGCSVGCWHSFLLF
ncbi:unnamed protein product [Meloidogyne enterolobii]|uniref:Uncharacterized protein n=1 Tax=Meloidogyne enterolobii TaxID=390850 RepID=A0ACB0ZV64_MELEN